MKDKSITLSPKHGLNPSITCCEVCGKELGLALFGQIRAKDGSDNDIEAPKKIHQGLCDDCQNVIDQGGLLIIEVRDGESGNNPYRTGRITGITKDAKERIFKDFKGNVAYMEETMFSQMFNGEFNKEQDNEDNKPASQGD